MKAAQEAQQREAQSLAVRDAQTGDVINRFQRGTPTFNALQCPLCAGTDITTTRGTGILQCGRCSSVFQVSRDDQQLTTRSQVA